MIGEHAILDLGFDGFMQDFGEETLLDMTFQDGSTGAEMHNRYPVLYHEATRRVVDEYEREHPDRKIFFYSGSPGSAAFEGANFPGDESTDWTPASGIASLAPDMLNRAVGGAYGFSTDIGGYLDVRRFLGAPGSEIGTTKELLIRWTQWATFSPIFRLHGANPVGTHVPWMYDAETIDIYRVYSELRTRVAPLIHELWEEATRTGIPPTRPMWLAEPDSPQARAADQQWMLGDDMLVAPVVVEGATSREVYFPQGCWEDPLSKRRFSGPTTATVSAPLEVLPYFLRCRKRVACETGPQAGCRLPLVSVQSRLRIEDRTTDTADLLRWTWVKGAATTLGELGDPTTTDGYFLCVYDAGVRVSSIALPAGGLCAGKPCWKSKSTGFVYENEKLSPDGAGPPPSRRGPRGGRR